MRIGPMPWAARTEFISDTIDDAEEACAGVSPGAAAAIVSDAIAKNRLPFIVVPPASTVDLFLEAYEVS
jgi:hypothetical protein